MAEKSPWTIGLANTDDFFPKKLMDFRKNRQKKSKLLIKLTFRGPIEVLKVDSWVVFHADLGYERPGSPKLLK